MAREIWQPIEQFNDGAEALVTTYKIGGIPCLVTRVRRIGLEPFENSGCQHLILDNLFILFAVSVPLGSRTPLPQLLSEFQTNLLALLPESGPKSKYLEYFLQRQPLCNKTRSNPAFSCGSIEILPDASLSVITAGQTILGFLDKSGCAHLPFAPGRDPIPWNASSTPRQPICVKIFPPHVLQYMQKHGIKPVLAPPEMTGRTKPPKYEIHWKCIPNMPQAILRLYGSVPGKITVIVG